MKKRASSSSQTGMTLVEIMIALLIGAFLIAGILQIFISTKQTYRMQEALSRIQENGRFAMELISRDIRTAGFWGCTDVTAIENKLNADTTFNSFATALAAQNDDNGGNDGDTDNDENGNNIWDGTDSLTLRGATGQGVSLTADPSGLAADIAVTNNSGLKVNDFVVISNCVSGDIFQITAVTPGDTISHGNGNTGELGNASTALGVGNPDASVYTVSSNPQIYKLNFVTYQIRNGVGNQPALFRSINGGSFQELIEGIENMQILYGEDTDATSDQTPNRYVISSSADMNKVVSIRIIITVRSLESNLTSSGDKRLRRTFSSTIALRNRLQ